ncbi:MAG: NAD-dependent epimerase/dehydratase family protein [Gemmatimonadota bacterium]|nr:MAG: NAD-dependent epimerase/dehydratase family protein [Gemmatimonadota bacterium]
MARIAITGAGGFFSRALEPRLAERAPLRGLFRSPSDRSDAWRSLGHEVVFGDLQDGEALRALVEGVDVIYHLAARRGKDDLDASRRVNVAGSEHLARAAAEAGVGRLVYVSSISVYAATDVPDGTITEEVEPHSVGLLSPYSATKYEGELALRRLADTGDAPPVTIVRPTNVYGPWGRSWYLDWVARIRRLPLVIGGDIPVDLVHVDDIAAGLIQAGESPMAEHETLHLGHQSVLLADFATRVGRSVGVRVRRLPRVPDHLARVAIEHGHRLLHGHRRGTSLTRRVSFPHDRARRLVGYAPRVSLNEGFEGLERWYRAMCGGDRV